MAVDWDPGWAFQLTTRAGETMGPVRSDGAYVHRAARESVARTGGTCVVLRAVDDGWRQVAEYTDRGAAIVAVDEVRAAGRH